MPINYKPYTVINPKRYKPKPAKGFAASIQAVQHSTSEVSLAEQAPFEGQLRVPW